MASIIVPLNEVRIPCFFCFFSFWLLEADSSFPALPLCNPKHLSEEGSGSQQQTWQESVPANQARATHVEDKVGERENQHPPPPIHESADKQTTTNGPGCMFRNECNFWRREERVWGGFLFSLFSSFPSFPGGNSSASQPSNGAAQPKSKDSAKEAWILSLYQ